MKKNNNMMMNITKKLAMFAATAMLAVAASSCSDEVSYADRLNSERNACNAFLATKRVVNEIPADTIFEVGENAPFYRIDNEGNVYMQVIKSSDRKADKAKVSETIYFRYTRYNIVSWYETGSLIPYDGNATDMSTSSSYFNYSDYTLPASSQWGYGLQMPLNFLGVECEVKLLVKSQYGLTSEISYVMPFLYHVRYFHSKI